MLKSKAKIINSQLVFDMPNFFKSELKRFEDKEVEVVIKTRNKPMSLSQFKFYTVIINKCRNSSYFAGCTVNEIEEAFLFLITQSKTTIKIGNEEHLITTMKVANEIPSFTSAEMRNYLDKMLDHCSLMGIEIEDIETYKSRL